MEPSKSDRESLCDCWSNWLADTKENGSTVPRMTVADIAFKKSLLLIIIQSHFLNAINQPPGERRS